MNQFEMIAVIVIAVMVAGVLKAKYARGGSTGPTAEEQAENMRLRDEVRELKDRLHVLERIATEKENSLGRQIEELRDR